MVQPDPLSMGTGVLSRGGKEHLRPMQRLRVGGAILLLPTYAYKENFNLYLLYGHYYYYTIFENPNSVSNKC